jgi:hypothetical protein
VSAYRIWRVSAYRITLIIGGGRTYGLIYRNRDMRQIAGFDDMALATTICAELNQAAMHGRITRKERTMKKAKPMPKPTKPGKKKGC